MPETRSRKPSPSGLVRWKKESGKLEDAPKKARLKELQGEILLLQKEIRRVTQLTERKVRQLEELSRFSGLLNSSLDLREVEQRALEATCRLLSCETASVLLIDFERAELFWHTALGDAGKILVDTARLPIDDRSVAGRVAMTGERVVVTDAAKDPRHFARSSELSGGFQTRNLIAVPLYARGRVVGVLEAINKLPRSAGFEPEDADLLESLGHQVAIALDNSRLYQDLRGSFYDTVEALAESIEKKDSYTGGHTKRVVHFALCIAKYLPLSQEQVERLRLGALLHDVGKIGIDDRILRKAAPLDDAEWQIMKRHPELGHSILGRVESLKDVLGAMRFHHERWDGNGYPLGLRGEEIPFMARIVAVADAYDAMVSTRPYRKGMDPGIARDEIVRNRGTQFDPRVVDAFCQAFEVEKMGQRTKEARYAAGD